MITLTIFISLLALFQSPNPNVHELCKERCIPIRAFLPFTIILGHISLLSGKELGDFNWIGMFAVGVFFFMSGYGLEHKRQNGSICINGLSTRIRKLLFPLTLPCITYFATLYVCDADALQVIAENIKGFCIILPFTWFVIVECFMYAIFYIIAHYVKSSKSFFIIITGTVILFSIINTSVSHIAYLSLSNLAFPAGVFYKQHEIKILKSMSLRTTILTIVIINVLAIVLKNTHNYFIPLEILVWTILAITLYSKINFKLSNFTLLLSEISYEIYLCQGITFVIIGQGAKNGNILVHIISAFFLTAIIAYTCHIITKYLTNHLFKK